MKRFFCALTVLLFMFSITACSKNENTNMKRVSVYFTAENLEGKTDRLINAEHYYILKQGVQDEISAVFELMKGKASLGGYRSALPKELVLNKATVKNGAATLDVSKEYNRLSGLSRTIANACLTLSLCSLGDITSVSVTVDGVAPYDEDSGKALRASDIVLNNLKLIKFEKSIVLYFANRDLTALIPEVRNTVSRENESAEHLIILGLMEGPTLKTSNPVIPKGTKLLSIYTDHKICYLNLSKEFVINRRADKQSELLTIYGVVNSLTELSEIERVQFLIDGAKVRGFNYFDLSQPFERDLTV